MFRSRFESRESRFEVSRSRTCFQVMKGGTSIEYTATSDQKQQRNNNISNLISFRTSRRHNDDDDDEDERPTL